MSHLQRLNQTDISTLIKLAREIWEEHYTGVISQEQIDYMLELFYSEERILQELKDGAIWEILWLESKPIGYLSCVLENQKLYISKIYLKAQNRGKGLGKLMVDHALNHAKIHNKSAIYLNVNKYNAKSISFYKKQGFIKTKEEVNDIGNGFVMDDFVYEKLISSDKLNKQV